MKSGSFKLITLLYNIFMDIFYPKRCIICNSFINIGKSICICRDCEPVLKKQGSVDRDNSKCFEEVVAALEYKDNVKEAMTQYKFRNLKYYNKTFAYVIYNKIKDREFLNSISCLCPVPIHPLREREYNQSALVADVLSEYTSIPCYPDMLLKLRHLTPLSKMNFNLRKRMIKFAFDFNLKYNIEGKNICLVDDIYTSGSTVDECSKILRMYGAKKVYVLSACYVTKKETGGSKNADTDIANM